MKKILLALCVIGLLSAGCNSTQPLAKLPIANNAHPFLKSSQPPAAKTCLPGFIKVPGNALYKTPDFCVMKYDAKAVSIANPTVGIEPKLGDPCDGENAGHSYQTYKNNGPGCAAAAPNGKEIASVASGFPIAYIPEIGSGSDNAKVIASTWAGIC